MSVLLTIEVIVYGTDDADGVERAFGSVPYSDLRLRVGRDISDAVKKSGARLVAPGVASNVRSAKARLERRGE